MYFEVVAPPTGRMVPVSFAPATGATTVTRGGSRTAIWIAPTVSTTGGVIGLGVWRMPSCPTRKTKAYLANPDDRVWTGG